MSIITKANDHNEHEMIKVNNQNKDSLIKLSKTDQLFQSLVTGNQNINSVYPSSGVNDEITNGFDSVTGIDNKISLKSNK